MGYSIRSKGSMARTVRHAFRPSENRRRDPRARIPAGPHGALLVGGIDVKLRNLSRRGMLFESPVRLLVGAPAMLRMRGARGWIELRGQVVRCGVSATFRGRLRYETALALDDECPIDELTGLLGVTSDGEVTIIDPESGSPLPDPKVN